MEKIIGVSSPRLLQGGFPARRIFNGRGLTFAGAGYSITRMSPGMDNEFQYDVFLSHSAKDKAVVRDLAARLKKDGVRVWLDDMGSVAFEK